MTATNFDISQQEALRDGEPLFAYFASGYGQASLTPTRVLTLAQVLNYAHSDQAAAALVELHESKAHDSNHDYQTLKRQQPCIQPCGLINSRAKGSDRQFRGNGLAQIDIDDPDEGDYDLVREHPSTVYIQRSSSGGIKALARVRVTDDEDVVTACMVAIANDLRVYDVVVDPAIVAKHVMFMFGDGEAQLVRDYHDAVVADPDGEHLSRARRRLETQQEWSAGDQAPLDRDFVRRELQQLRMRVLAGEDPHHGGQLHTPDLCEVAWGTIDALKDPGDAKDLLLDVLGDVMTRLPELDRAVDNFTPGAFGWSGLRRLGVSAEHGRQEDEVPVDAVFEPVEVEPVEVEPVAHRFYYCQNKFYIQDADDEMDIEVITREMLNDYLGTMGMVRADEKEAMRVAIRERMRVKAVMPLHFQPTGIIRRVLNVSDIRLLQPGAACQWGEGFPRIADTLSTAFGEELGRFNAWHQHFYRCCLASKPQQGLGLVCCGPADTGKKWLLQGLLAQVWQGTADASQYFLGRDQFSAELTKAPIWYVSDLPSSGKDADTFSRSIKEVIAEGRIRCRPMYGEKIDVVQPGMRVMVFVNDDPTSAKGLPKLDRNTADKLLCLRMFKASAETVSEQGLFPDDETIAAELPAYLGYLMHTHETPDAWKDKRFGIKGWADPIVSNLSEESHDTGLPGLVERLQWWLATTPDVEQHDLIKRHWRDVQLTSWQGEAYLAATKIGLYELMQETSGGTLEKVARNFGLFGHQLDDVVSAEGSEVEKANLRIGGTRVRCYKVPVRESDVTRAARDENRRIGASAV